jgi:hypothetical protein
METEEQGWRSEGYIPENITPVDHGQQHLFHVLFSNGYENMFFTDVETGRWLEEDLGDTALAAAMATWFEPFLPSKRVGRKRVSWCRLHIGATNLCFGFLKRMENGRTVFEVYSDNRKFLCNLRRSKKGRWVIYGAARTDAEWQYRNRLEVITRVLEE